VSYLPSSSPYIQNITGTIRHPAEKYLTEGGKSLIPHYYRDVQEGQDTTHKLFQKVHAFDPHPDHPECPCNKCLGS
jgi:hypothetical protein